MEPILSAPCTPAQRQRDVLLGALVGLARSTVNEPKTEDTDHVLAAGLRQAANADAAEEALARMTGSWRPKSTAWLQLRHLHDALRQHRQYDLARLWSAPENIRALKLRMLRCVFQLAAGPPGCRRPGSDRPGPVCAGRGLGRNPAPARGPTGGGTLPADKLSCNRPGVLLPRSAGAVLFFRPFQPLFSAVRA